MLCTLSTWECSMCITAGGPWTGPMLCIACLALSSRVIVQPLGLGGLTIGAYTGWKGILRLLHLRLESALGLGTPLGDDFKPVGTPLLPCLGGGLGLSALACTRAGGGGGAGGAGGGGGRAGAAGRPAGGAAQRVV